jgi:hypothetical protein
MKTIVVTIVGIALLVGTAAYAQEPATPDQPSEEAAGTPATLAGQSEALRVGSQRLAGNYLAGGVAFTTMYTDNAEFTPTGAVSDTSYLVEPQLALQHTASRLSWGLASDAGILVNQRLHGNEISFNVGGDVLYRVSPRVTFRISDTVLRTFGIGSTDTARIGEGISVLDQPNVSASRFNNMTFNAALAEVTFQYTERTAVGIRGSHSIASLPDRRLELLEASAYGSQSYAVETFCTRRFSARHWGGIVTRLQRLQVSGIGVTNAGSILMMYGVQPSRRTTLTVFGGPELSHTPATRSAVAPPTADSRLLAPVVGATFGWQGLRTGTTLSYVRQVSDGGGLASNVTLDSADVAVRRLFGLRQDIELGFGYSSNDPILEIAPTTRVYTGRIQYSRLLWNNFRVRALYGRDHYRASDRLVPGDRNRVAVSLIYSFGGALGR